jgi:hypothetical protein
MNPPGYPYTNYFVAAYVIVAFVYAGYIYSLWHRSRRVIARLDAQGRAVDQGGTS